jgi:hypothetical protein
MRFHITADFSAARSEFEQAARAYSACCDVPGITLDEELHGPESKAESAALDRLLGFPAATAAEIGAKLAFMREREAYCWTGYPAWIEQIERELTQLQRPCVSSAMAQAFHDWSASWTAFVDDPDDGGMAEASAAAFLALMDVPCFTPGDFIAKVYVNQLGEHGYTCTSEDAGGFLFELDQQNLTGSGGTHDDAAQIAIARDIRDCDLGRCMLALGRVDFDPAGWIAASRRAQMKVYVVIQHDGSHWLYTGEPDGEVDGGHGDRFFICQALIAGGLGVIGQDRRSAVIDYIIDHEPKLVIDCRQRVEAAA